VADIQTRDALKVLDIISSPRSDGESYTYSSVAQILGRTPPQNNARAVAQMCDLLDAAACLAGVPMFALIRVLEKPLRINPKAWRNYPPLKREAIIRRSLEHTFRSSDFRRIRQGLKDLGNKGNRTAWKYLEGLYEGDLLYRRLIGDYEEIGTVLNAISDIGADAPDRALSQRWTYERDPKVREAVLQRAQGRCEYCGQPGFLMGDGRRYLETHHIIALANEGADKPTNVIAVCANDHREAHFGQRRVAIELEMIAKVSCMSWAI